MSEGHTEHKRKGGVARSQKYQGWVHVARIDVPCIQVNLDRKRIAKCLPLLHTIEYCLLQINTLWIGWTYFVRQTVHFGGITEKFLLCFGENLVVSIN